MERSVKLTQRGQQVAELVALGLSSREIASRLFISERTVEWHIEQVLNKLGFSSRSQIAAWVSRTQTGAVLSPGAKHRGNLPTPMSSFIGRKSDVLRLKELIAGNRVVTVVGPGGVGKTRLAIKVGEEIGPAYPDGVWLCDLAPLSDSRLVGDAVAQALGLSAQTGDRLDAARDHLRERTALLVLDNCEHVLAAAAELSHDLLAHCPNLSIVATSLAPLDVLAEAVWRLRPLPEDEALRLFLARAKAAVPDLEVDDRIQVAFGSICTHLERLPLALELAAPHLRVLNPHQLVGAVIESGKRFRSETRHNSLEALADWGYRALREPERDLFRRLSVFAGWFELEDAAAVEPPDAPTSQLLTNLVENSMVISDRSSGGPRYRLLETLKTFARKRLSESGELEPARLAHADRMVWLCEGLGLRSAQNEDHLWTKASEMVDDMRAAMTALLELRPRRAAWLAGSLRWFWRNTGRLSEGVRWTAAALDASADDSVERCWALHGQAILLLRSGRVADSQRCLREAIRLAALSECDQMRGEFLQAQSIVHAGLGDVAAAENASRLAFDEHTRVGRPDRAALTLNDRALWLLVHGRFLESRELAERGVEEQTRFNSGRVHFTVETLAQAHAFLGEIEQARTRWLEAASAFLTNGEVLGVAGCLEGLAFTAGMRNRTEVALRLHSCAAHIFSELSDSNIAEPITPKVHELVDRLEKQAGAERAARLRNEGEALTPVAALRLAESEG